MRVTYSFVSTEPSIRPRLIFGFDFTPSSKPNAPASTTGLPTLEFSDFVVEMKIIGMRNSGNFYVGYLVSQQPYVALQTNVRRNLVFSLDLDQYELREIEKLRESKDLNLIISFSFTSSIQSQPATKMLQSAQIIIKVHKSDWVENFLPALGYKTVSLIEISQLNSADFRETIEHTDNAWKQYSMGEYSVVFTECRKALESLATCIKSKGFEKASEEGSKKIVPDWSKLFGNDADLGALIGTINQKITGFVAPGSHAGSAINKEDADFALMTTHAMVNLVVRKYSANS